MYPEPEDEDIRQALAFAAALVDDKVLPLPRAPMRLLLDRASRVPQSTNLDAAGVEPAHVGEKGLATASDAKIIQFARQGGWIVVTLDRDFRALLALAGATGPSVVRQDSLINAKATTANIDRESPGNVIAWAYG